MQIDIQARGFDLTDATRDYVVRRLNAALFRSEPHIRRVAVRLFETQGAGSAVDKRCRVQVMLERHPAVVVEDTQADLHAAIERAAERAGRTLLRLSRLQHALAAHWPHDRSVDFLVDGARPAETGIPLVRIDLGSFEPAPSDSREKAGVEDKGYIEMQSRSSNTFTH